MTINVRIRLGQTEIEYEGTEEFFKAELPSLLEAVSTLRQELDTLARPEAEMQESDSSTLAAPTAPSTVGTTNSIAAKLDCKSGTDLVLAAAARLTLGEEQPSFSRQALLEEMKTASSYYKKTYGHNLNRSLHVLLKSKRLNERSHGNYTLTVNARQELESKLAE